jgi:uncharacterized protein YwgA
VRDREDIVTAVLSAAGGTLTGRVRMQKMAYLLDQLGLDSGFDYEYNHYGPFSRDLENATADAKAFGLITEEIRLRQSDGAAYSIFKLNQQPTSPTFGTLSPTQAGKLVNRFAHTDVTVLELAATIDWLRRFEASPDWKKEIMKRKGIKVQDGRLEKAVELLTELGLMPPASAQP